MVSTKSHSSAKYLRIICVSAAAGVALVVSAAAGAWMQSQFHDRASAAAYVDGLAEEARGDAEYIRQNVAMLAAKVGSLQAKVAGLEGLGRRVAETAGLAYTDPEIQAALEQSFLDVNADVAAAATAAWTAESLGRELDHLERELAGGSERLRMLDAVLTQRTGMKESMPSLRPVDEPLLSSSFGWRRHPVTGRHTMHEGLDFAAPRGTPIFAASGGVVTEARYVPGYGKMVEINHGNGMVTRYAHASSISVKLGALVSKGQQIARVGSTGRATGAHLHFEVRVAGHPLDPILFLEDVLPSGPTASSDTSSASVAALSATRP